MIEFMKKFLKKTVVMAMKVIMAGAAGFVLTLAVIFCPAMLWYGVSVGWTIAVNISIAAAGMSGVTAAIFDIIFFWIL